MNEDWKSLLWSQISPYFHNLPANLSGLFQFFHTVRFSIGKTRALPSGYYYFTSKCQSIPAFFIQSQTISSCFVPDWMIALGLFDSMFDSIDICHDIFPTLPWVLRFLIKNTGSGLLGLRLHRTFSCTHLPTPGLFRDPPGYS